MTDFTPGPWEVSGRDDRLWIAAPHPELGSKPVAMISPMPDEYVANARLIAQAPALYEALEAAEAHLNHVHESYADGGSCCCCLESWAGTGTPHETDCPGFEINTIAGKARAVLAAARGQ